MEAALAMKRNRLSYGDFKKMQASGDRLLFSVQSALFKVVISYW